MEERWHSVDEIAAYLGVSRETVYRWIDSKGLPAHRIGKFWKFKTSEVDAWARSDPSEGERTSSTEADGNKRKPKTATRRAR